MKQSKFNNKTVFTALYTKQSIVLSILIIDTINTIYTNFFMYRKTRLYNLYK